jgi:molecular chaperone DnaK
MPLVARKVKEIFGKEPYAKVNPDEVVASGAALQGSIMGGEIAEVLLLDVTPFSLGLRTVGDGFKALIEKNTTIPIRRSEIFTTTEENQTFVRIGVLQGEGLRASQNHPLGEFELVGIQPQPAGRPRIEVAFEINADGLLRVAAKDKETGQNQSIVIKPATGLDREMVERLSRNARGAGQGNMAGAPAERPARPDPGT